MKIDPADPAKLLGTPHQQGKSERALGKCKAKSKSAVALIPRYSEEFNHSGEEYVSKSTKCPALMLVERQGREKQDGQTEGRIEQVNRARVKAMTPPLLHDLDWSGSDSDVPLAKRHVAARLKRAGSLAGTRTKPKTGKEEASPLPSKKRGRPKVKALARPSEDPSDKVMNITETADTGRRTKVPRKRKEHVKASVDKDDDNNDGEYENMCGLPQKKRRRADLTARYSFLTLIDRSSPPLGFPLWRLK